jgi:hypothetical protein
MKVSYRSIGEGGLAELTALLEWAAPSSLRISPGPGRIPPSVTKYPKNSSHKSIGISFDLCWWAYFG